MLRVLIGLVVMMLPTAAQAAVYISEVAWMGDSESANHEWIELHNDGDVADVTGWTIDDGMNLSIELDGVVPAGSYAVLERTSEESSRASAFMIYTGALVNTGATLKLKRVDGSIVDQVVGGEDWSLIGGDNVTKETAQYTSGGWVTAVATPGDANQTKSVATASNNIKSSSGTGRVAKPVEKIPTVLTLPGVNLQLEIVAPSTGYVNQPVNFTVVPSGIGDTLIDSLQYEWNFGDTYTSGQKEPAHVFKYPGTYIVTVYASYKRQEQVTRHEITILPVNVSLTSNSKGDIQINNDSPYEIDISNYTLIGKNTVTLPPRSILLPNQTITIEKKRVEGISKSMLALYDTEGILLDSLIPGIEKVSGVTQQKPAPIVSSISTSHSNDNPTNFSFINQAEASQHADEGIEESTNETEVADLQPASISESKLPQNWPYLALVILLLFASVAVLISPKRNEIP